MKTTGRFSAALWFVVWLVGLILAGTPTVSTAANLPRNIGLGTHRVGLAYYGAGVGLAKVISENSPIKVVVKPFAGPNAWMPLLNSGDLEMGLLSGMDAGWAFHGGPGYPRVNKNLRVLLKGNLVDVIVVVRNSSDIRKLQDLKGRRLTSDYGGNVIVKRILTAYLASAGMGWNDVKRVPVPDVASGFQAVREGRADAAFGGSPITGALRELDAAVHLRALPFEESPAALAKARELLPSATPVLLKKGNGILRADVTALHYPNYLAASSKLSDDAAYEIVKTLWVHYKELHPIHPWLRGWVRERMFDPDPPAPYHPGAIRFFKEQGLWNATAEKNEERLLHASR